MTCKELAEILLKTPDLTVYVRGYEAGLEDVKIVRPVRVNRDHPELARCSFYGPHSDFDKDEDDTKIEPTPGILLDRET